MFLKIFLAASMMVLSCSPVAKESSLAKNLTILSATESTWVGGVRGVRGKIYTVKVKSSLKQKINFTGLNIDSEKVPVTATVKSNVYTVTARTTENNELPNMGEEPAQESAAAKSFVLEYSEGESKVVRKLNIPKFTKVATVIKDGEAPVQ